MRPQVLILSDDAVFARMLELEFSMQRLRVRMANALQDGMDSDVVLLDLDSVPPPQRSDARIIGFTRSFAISEMDTGRICSMILHRPFEVRLLREEVLAFLGCGDAKADPEKNATLRLEGSRLCYGEAEVELSPKERAVAACLLSHRNETVSRETVASLIGESSANKVDVYICYLRRKAATLSDRLLIRTVRGKGYRIE